MAFFSLLCAIALRAMGPTQPSQEGLDTHYVSSLILGKGLLRLALPTSKEIA